jgi:hypothetical protein
MIISGKRPRGRPHGSGKDDSPYLAQVAEILIREPSLKPTTAMKRVMTGRAWTETDETLIRRWQAKWKEQGQLFLSAARACVEPRQTVPLREVLASLQAAQSMNLNLPALAEAQRAIRALQMSPGIKDMVEGMRAFRLSPAFEQIQETIKAYRESFVPHQSALKDMVESMRAFRLSSAFEQLQETMQAYRASFVPHQIADMIGGFHNAAALKAVGDLQQLRHVPPKFNS